MTRNVLKLLVTGIIAHGGCGCNQYHLRGMNSEQEQPAEDPCEHAISDCIDAAEKSDNIFFEAADMMSKSSNACELASSSYKFATATNSIKLVKSISRLNAACYEKGRISFVGFSSCQDDANSFYRSAAQWTAIWSEGFDKLDPDGQLSDFKLAALRGKLHNGNPPCNVNSEQN